MNKYHAVVIEQSLANKKVLGNFKILGTKHSGEWDLDILEIEDLAEAIKIIQPEMVSDKPFYWHIYDDNNSLIVVFREKLFKFDPKDKSTWAKAQEYGAKLLGIPSKQLDFYPTQFSDEPEWLAGRE